MQKYKSVYKSDLNLQGDITVTLSADERMVICEALAKVAPKEADIFPLILLADKLATKQKGER